MPDVKRAARAAGTSQCLARRRAEPQHHDLLWAKVSAQGDNWAIMMILGPRLNNLLFIPLKHLSLLCGVSLLLSQPSEAGVGAIGKGSARLVDAAPLRLCAVHGWSYPLGEAPCGNLITNSVFWDKTVLVSEHSQ